MKTRIKKTGDTIVIRMEGKLGHEEQEPFRTNLSKLAFHSQKDEAPLKFIFDLENLEFVGSTGISSFIQILKEFNGDIPTKPRYCNVSSEFQKIIKAFDQNNLFEFYDDQEIAKKSFDH